MLIINNKMGFMNFRSYSEEIAIDNFGTVISEYNGSESAFC